MLSNPLPIQNTCTPCIYCVGQMLGLVPATCKNASMQACKQRQAEAETNANGHKYDHKATASFCRRRLVDRPQPAAWQSPHHTCMCPMEEPSAWSVGVPGRRISTTLHRPRTTTQPAHNSAAPRPMNNAQATRRARRATPGLPPATKSARHAAANKAAAAAPPRTMAPSGRAAATCGRALA